ncbi:MAG: dihydrolipoamide dehydrogenase [Bacteroidetes bacterium]|nr:MAG: dihydrolipoamide dehydrogenase [Bacteroidota bacterium]
MKKLLLIMFVFTLSYAVNAQIQTPAPSPASTLIQKVGLTDVTIEYSRPAMRGRTIFGDLVPYGKIWRTAANARTKVTFSDDVSIGGKTVKAGSYAIFTIPQATKWEVIFYSEYQGSGAPQTLDESKVAARIMTDVIPMEMDIQSFTITIDDITSSSAVIGIMWEKAYVPVPFGVPTDAAVMASIDAALAGPSANDYYNAAAYYLSEGKDAAKAKEWIDKAMSMFKEPAFWQLRQQSLVYAAAGDKKGAIEIAKKSLAASEAAGNADYIKMNKDSLAEWMQ